MHMAEASGIKTVPHSLIRFADGELCYITRRVDRTKKSGKIAMEDMCQLSSRLTEDKYKGSYERIAKIIKEHSSAPLLNVVNFWEIVLFSWITGNTDMHLKNFSLYKPDGKCLLTPAYDLLSTALVMPEDTEELALSLNGKKRKINRDDFVSAMLDSGLNSKVVNNIFSKFEKSVSKWNEIIDESFLPDNMKLTYKQKILKQIDKIKLTL